jgi:antitoxin component YwqK of YwqJK toxin-antitoxin module
MARLVKKYTNYGTLEAEYFVVPDENGKEVIEGEYKEYIDDSETISKIINYSNGKKNGEEIEYHDYDKGIIYSIKYFVDGKKEGTHVKYIDNKVFEICNYKNDELHGEFKEYYMNSDILYQDCFYYNGEYHGIFKEYHRNGTIKYIKDGYDNGRLTGFEKEYDENSKLKIVTCYINSYKTFEFEISDPTKGLEIDDELMSALDRYYDKIKN